MSSFWGPPPASPPEPTREERRKQEQEKERQIAEEEYHLRKAQCARWGCENDEPRCLCAECQDNKETV
jgi:hypothetical protein